MSIAIRDNLSGGVSRCKQITNLAAVVGFSTPGTVKLTWTNPTDEKYKGVRIMYKTGGYPTSPTDGSVFYDSNDASPVSTFTKNGFTDGTTYYFRAFTYTYKNATRLYTTTTDGAQATGKPLQIQGQQIFTNSGNFTIPAGVTAIDVFLVGGGGGSGNEYNTGWGGSGGGYTLTEKKLAVTPGTTASVLIGAGGVGVDGGATTFTIGSKTLTANGGKKCFNSEAGAGGSGGGGGGQYNLNAGNGGSDGSDGNPSVAIGTQAFTKVGGAGQGSTTRAFGESGGTLYSGGGGGAWSPTGYTGKRGLGGASGGGNGQEVFSTTNIATSGTANTGGGAGGHYDADYTGVGGSGIAIVRWGY